MSIAFTPSGAALPCPICGRTKDGDYRILSDGRVFCHTDQDGRKGHPHATALYIYLGRSNESQGFGMWKPEMDAYLKVPRPSGTTYFNYRFWDGSEAPQRYRKDIEGQPKEIKWAKSLNGRPQSDVAPYRWEKFDLFSEQLFIVRGELKADLLSGKGLQAISLINQADPKLEKELLQVQEEGLEIVLVPDCDEADIKKWFTTLCTALPKAKVLKTPGLPWHCPPAAGGLGIEDWIYSKAPSIDEIKAAIKSQAGGEIWNRKTGGFIDEIPAGWKGNKRSIIKSGDLAKILELCFGDNLKFNELTTAIEYKGQEVKGAKIDYFYVELSKIGYTISQKEAIHSLINQAKERSYHPIVDYFRKILDDEKIIPADISNLASNYLNSSNPLHNIMLRKTLIGAVARISEPGCKFDTCLVLAGKQGVGKSTFWKVLASPPWFCDTAQAQDKDLQLCIHSTWIYELAELETITTKKESGQIKALLSGSSDKFRAPYASSIETHDRRSIFVATCNRTDFLRDETGSRRYWVIDIPNLIHNMINIPELQKNRDAIWKAIVIAYQIGEQPFLDKDDEINSEITNKDYEPEEVWLAPMQRWLDGPQSPEEFTTDQAIVGAGVRQKENLNNDCCRRAARVLRELGYVQDKLKTNFGQRRVRMWRIYPNIVPAEKFRMAIDHTEYGQRPDQKIDIYAFNKSGIGDIGRIGSKETCDPYGQSGQNAEKPSAATSTAGQNAGWIEIAQSMRAENPSLAYFTIAFKLESHGFKGVNGWQVKEALAKNSEN